MHHPKGRTMKRLAVLALSFVLASLVTIVGVDVRPAAASEEDAILITAPTTPTGDTYTVEYPVGTLVGNDPSGEFHTPGDCVDLPTCALIPVKVTYPEGYDRENDEYFITVSISWEAGDITVPIPGRPAGQDSVHAQGNDLDNYFYVKELNEDGEEDYRQVAQAATSSNPESARWLGGADEYALIVSNYTGVSRGFTVTLKTTPAVFDAVTEDLGGGFRPSAPTLPSSSGSGGAALDSSAGGRNGFSSGPAASLPSGTSSRPQPVFSNDPTALNPLVGDASLDTFSAFGGSSAEFETALDGKAPQLFQPARQVGPPEPVAGSMIVFWLGIVPVLLAGLGAIVFWRRRPAALSFGGGPAPA